MIMYPFVSQLEWLFLSQILIYSLIFSCYNYFIVKLFHFSGIIILLSLLLYKLKRSRFSGKPYSTKSTLELIFSSIPLVILPIVFVFGSFVSLKIHPDARQYHLAFPWLMSLSGKLVQNTSLAHTGKYLGYDLLYMGVDNLSKLVNAPEIIMELKLFNSLSEALLPFSVFILCRSMGGSKLASSFSAICMYTIGSLGYWGLLKNDIIVAAIAMISLSMLLRCYKHKSGKLFIISSILAAFSISIKISVVVPLVIPFIFVYLSRKFSAKTCMGSILIGLIFMSPWFVSSCITRGNPIYPIGVSKPAAVKAAWALRSANGIERSPYNLLTMFPKVVLDQYHISGNQTLGILAIIVLCLSLCFFTIDLIKRNRNINHVIVMSILVWLAVFYYTRLDNRFLSRYILICPGVLFAFTAYRIETYLLCVNFISTRIIGAIGLCALIIISLFVANNKAIVNRFISIDKIFSSGIYDLEAHKAKMQESPYTVIRKLRKPGETVAINDGFVLYLEEPFINLHALHAARMDLYNKDAVFIRNILSERSATLLLLRQHISGGTEAVDNYIAECAQKIGRFGALTLYEVKDECKSEVGDNFMTEAASTSKSNFHQE